MVSEPESEPFPPGWPELSIEKRLEVWWNKHKEEMGNQAQRYKRFLENFCMGYDEADVKADRAVEAWLNFQYDLRLYQYKHPDLLIEGFLTVYNTSVEQLGVRKDALPRYRLVTFGKITEQYFETLREAEELRDHYEGMESLERMNVFVIEPLEAREALHVAAQEQNLREAENKSRQRLEEMVQKLKDTIPGIEAEINRNVAEYGVPILFSTYGALWAEDLPGIVNRILVQEALGHPVEIVLRPEDTEGHHWQAEFYILKPVGEKLVRAIDYERGKEKG